jgi:NAD(P)-dependent dehydrogenase (short-subunit alcohol dehydrogenase family)
MTAASGLVVVTGASTGIGRATAEHLAAAGFHVLAGVRNEEAAQASAAEGIEPVRLDVTDADQIADLARRVAEDPDGRPLQAVVNNAGIAVAAPVEVIPLAEWRRQFEVNLFGQIAVIQALLPALIVSRGRIVNVSSIGGRVVGPTYGAYSGSKFALEAVSDALRRELKHLGVGVVVIEPGAIATPIWEKGLATASGLTDAMTAAQGERYRELNAAARRRAHQAARDGVPPDQVARVITTAVTARRPRTRYLVGRDAKITARLATLLPDSALDRLIGGRGRRD